MTWTKHDKVIMGGREAIRDGSGTYGCAICWSINKGYENNHRIKYGDPECPVCKVEFVWKDSK